MVKGYVPLKLDFYGEYLKKHLRKSSVINVGKQHNKQQYHHDTMISMVVFDFDINEIM